MAFAEPLSQSPEERAAPPFRHRRHAGRMLARHLHSEGANGFDVMLVIARGGLPVADEVMRLIPSFAQRVIPVTVQRVFHPQDGSLAIGAVSDDETWLHDDLLRLFPCCRSELDIAVASARKKLGYRSGRLGAWSASLRWSTHGSVALLDDVVATGASMAAVDQAVRRLTGGGVVAFVAPVVFSPARSLLEKGSGQVLTLVEASRSAPFDGSSFYAEFAPVKGGS